MMRPPPSSTLFPYTPLFRSGALAPRANPRLAVPPGLPLPELRDGRRLLPPLVVVTTVDHGGPNGSDRRDARGHGRSRAGGGGGGAGIGVLSGGGPDGGHRRGSGPHRSPGGGV